MLPSSLTHQRENLFTPFDINVYTTKQQTFSRDFRDLFPARVAGEGMCLVFKMNRLETEIIFMRFVHVT